MCAKYAKKKKRRQNGLITAIVLLTILLIFMLLLAWNLHNNEETPSIESSPVTGPSTSADMPESFPSESATQTTVPAQVEEIAQLEYPLGKGLTLLEVGKYVGIYMEDGTDEIVSDVLMLIVRNDGEQDIQYAEFTIPTSAGDARFSLSTLPVGERIVLLEQNRMRWSANEDYSNVNVENVAVFSEPTTLCEDRLEFQTMDGVINITNISGDEITGDIVIYYKNAAADLLYGGITYRIRLEGGLKTDEIRQIMASHFTQSGSRIMFVTIE